MQVLKNTKLLVLLILLIGVIICGIYIFNNYHFKNYKSAEDNKNVILVDNETKKLHNISVTKSGNAENEQADFHGTNAAILAQNEGQLTIKKSKISTNGEYANGVFSYGENTIINIENTDIITKGDYSGGIMTTGHSTMNAKNLNIETFGDSSAPIRSDRGGGNVNVEGGNYISNGLGSPSIYSTAHISVSNATLNSNNSEAVVVERGNDVTLNNCNITGNNTQLARQSKVKNNIMLYHSMPDSSDAFSEFTANDSTIKSKTGPMFYVTNTTTKVNLNNTKLILNNNELLRIEKGPWGPEDNNGGKVAFLANHQILEGNIFVDSISALNLILSEDSTFTGKIESKGKVYVKLAKGTTWKLTGDSNIDGLTCDENAIDLNGHKLLIDNKEYKGGQSKGKAIEIAFNASLNDKVGIDENRDGNPPEPPKDENGNSLPPPDKSY